MTTPPEYREKFDTATARLMAALDPQTDDERRVAQWLCDWDLYVIDTVTAMVERRLRSADQREAARRDDAATACVASSPFGPSCPDAGNQPDKPRHSPAVTKHPRPEDVTLRPGVTGPTPNQEANGHDSY